MGRRYVERRGRVVTGVDNYEGRSVGAEQM